MKPRPDPKAGMAAAGDVLFGRRLRSLREKGDVDVVVASEWMEAGRAIGKIEAGERVVSVGEGAEFARVLGIDLTQLLNVGQRRLVTAQLKVTSLEHQAEEYARRLHETQVLLDDTLTSLEDARAQLKEREAEQ